MVSRLSRKTRWQGVVLALLALPLGVWAQTVSAPAQIDWRAANDAVGQFKRGHIDLLKWERAHVPARSDAQPEPPGLVLATVQDAVRQGWRAHPDLAEAQSRLGEAHLTLIAQGRWTEVDLGLQRRVEDMGEVLAVAAEARKAWVQAVAAAQVVRYREASLDNAAAAQELGQRMVAVGNWSVMEGRPGQLALVSARMDLRRAQVAAAQAQAALLQTLKLVGQQARVGLPEVLAAAPAQVLDAATLSQRVVALQAQQAAAGAGRSPAMAQNAYEVYRASHALLQDSAEAVKLRELITEEAGLRYNGMLASVWDLLGDVRNQTQAQIDAIGALRDFWLAETDLQWVLQGGLPTSFVSLGAGGGDVAPAGGH